MTDSGYLFSVVTMVNDDEVYELSRQTLQEQHASSEIQWVVVRPDIMGCGASEALNAGIEQAQSDWVVLAHQDILYPTGWWGRVTAQLNSHKGAPIGVAGLVGVDRKGLRHGHVLDAHGHLWSSSLPESVVSLDEHVLILRKDSGLRFDPELPGFHCYGTDLCLEARSQGFASIAIDAPVIHLSPGKIDDSYVVTAEWLLNKWRSFTGGVIPTPAHIIYDRSLRSMILRGWVEVTRRLLMPKKPKATVLEAFRADACVGEARL
ncbi:MAG: glycosyltransferase family A protein [Planctomycetota bacterium]